jgi:hypothetical protein
MRVVALDPGLRPGVVELDGATGVVLRVASSLRAAAPWLFAAPGWDIAATEGQWYFGGKRAGGPRGARGGAPDVNDLLQLAFRAGFGLACIPAARSLRIPPQDWRAALGYGAGLTKEQVQKKIAKDLTAPERVLFQGIPPARHGDVLDAIGIGRAAIILAPTTTTHDWNVYR